VTKRISKQELSASLSEALAPPKRKLARAIDLSEYDDEAHISLPDSTRLTEFTRLVDNIPPKTTSLIATPDLAPQKTRLVESTSLVESGSRNGRSLNLMASLPDVSGYTKLWHQMTDHLYSQLTTAEQAVHIQLFRLSWGFGVPTCIIGLPKLAKRVGASATTIQKAIEGLIHKGLIKKLQIINGRGKLQGIEYEITPPPSLLKSTSLPESTRLPDSTSLVDSGTNKVNTQKESTQTQEMGVRVCSNFSIEECRKYAKHLQSTGQGINNPGGYATTIHRTGEADLLIESFLNPSAPVPEIDASQCPDCKGSGFYYPNGPGGGVTKCKHEKLLRNGN
jgi:DNA-binding Lrp family transcriptional regulator